MGREELLEKLRRLQAPKASELLPDSIPEFPSFENPIDTFHSELEKVGGVFLDGQSERSLREAFGKILSEQKSELLYWERPDILQDYGMTIAPFRKQDGCFYRSSHREGKLIFPLEIESVSRAKQPIEEIDISVGTALRGVAETGSVLIRSGSGRGRLLSILPPVHVVLLREADLVMNHRDWFSETNFGNSESALLLITGPSRTADIEKTLIIGVHGPQHLYVILTR